MLAGVAGVIGTGGVVGSTTNSLVFCYALVALNAAMASPAGVLVIVGAGVAAWLPLFAWIPELWIGNADPDLVLRACVWTTLWFLLTCTLTMSLARALRDAVIEAHEAKNRAEDNAAENEALRQRSEADRLKELDRKKRLEAAIGLFRTGAAALSSQMESGASGLQHTARSLQQVIEHSQDETRFTVDTLSEASSTIESLAIAATQLDAAVVEVSQQAMQVQERIRSADGQTQANEANVQNLTESVRSIGNLAETIQSIAAQTKLLAINATIEVSRAAEGGRAFGVVAAEVKNLAGQTTIAAAEIGRLIQLIACNTADVSAGAQNVRESLHSINHAALTTSSAVEKQMVATSKIARGAQQATSQTSQTREVLTRLQDVAMSTREASDQITAAAAEFLGTSKILMQTVDEFLTEVAA